MFETVFLMGVMSVFTLVAAILYGKRIVEAHRKYAEAKNIVDDIIVSFNRQLQRQEEQVEISARKIDAMSSHSKPFAEKLEGQEKEINALAKKVESFSTLQKALARIDNLEKELIEDKSMKDTLFKKITDMEKQISRPKVSETKIESAIPIKREKALAPLTETELTVLEFLAAEGKQTAPKIKEQIKLSREHTARLMKKLYEEGYLERSANKIPFTYRIKEEMRKILKKPEQKS